MDHPAQAKPTSNIKQIAAFPRYARSRDHGAGAGLIGPFLRVDSKAAYLDALRDDPPDPCDVEILSVTEDGDEVVVFYELLRANGKATVAQWFGFEPNGIHETRLVF